MVINRIKMNHGINRNEQDIRSLLFSLADSGHKVWVEKETDSSLTFYGVDYYICYESPAEFEECKELRRR